MLVKGGKILLQRRFNTGYSDGRYGLVSGHLEKGERIKDAMQREANEEAGITISKKDLSMKYVLHVIKDYEAVQLFLQTKHWKGKIRNMEPERCDELSWFRLSDLPSNMVPYVSYALKQMKKGKFFGEYREK